MESTNSINIQTVKLTKRFDREPILQEIELELPIGAKLALVGSNGSGKSTLLRALMGMISYDGKVLFTDPFGKKLLPSSVKDQIAYVPQRSPYFVSQVSDVVTTILHLRGIRLDNFIYYLALLNLDYQEVASVPFHKLSGGMKQKVLIALAFTSRPQVLLLDEPTSSLDTESRESFYRMGKNLSGSSMLLSSHQWEDIQELVDEVIVIDKGKIFFQGQTQDYLNKVLKKKY